MWQIFPDPGPICYAAVSPILIGVTLAGNILTDIYLISIPVPALLRASLGRVQKISLVSLFSCSSLITAMAIVRVVVIVVVSGLRKHSRSYLSLTRAPELEQQRRWRVGPKRVFRGHGDHQFSTYNSAIQKMALAMAGATRVQLPRQYESRHRSSEQPHDEIQEPRPKESRAQTEDGWAPSQLRQLGAYHRCRDAILQQSKRARCIVRSECGWGADRKVVEWEWK